MPCSARGSNSNIRTHDSYGDLYRLFPHDCVHFYDYEPYQRSYWSETQNRRRNIKHLREANG